jgi:hypothetical protein
MGAVILALRVWASDGISEPAPEASCSRAARLHQ